MKNNQQKLVIYIGCPASGKTTFRTEFLRTNKNYVAVSRDDFRYMLRNEGYLERNMENILATSIDGLIHNSLREGKSVIVDATNVIEKYLVDYKEFLKTFPHIKLEYKLFDVPLEELIARDAARKRSVGREVIERMFTSLELLKKSDLFNKQMASQNKQPVVQNPDLPQCIIVDLDGTVALFDESGYHYRSPYDASRCDEIDYVSIPVAMAIRGFVAQGVKCVFVSGREDNFKPQTERFLQKHFSAIDYELHMRSSERERGIDDRIVKKRILEEFVLNNYYTVAVFDDRIKVVEMWIEMGLFVFNVNNGAGAF